MKKGVLYASIAFGIQVACMPAAHAASPATPNINEEFSKQDKIYRSEGQLTPSGYVVNRSLVDYEETLSPEFDRTLASLGPTDRWLDIGAGIAQAILDYYAPNYDFRHPEERERRGKKARAVAMSIEDRRTPVWHQTAERLDANQIRYVSSKPLRDYSVAELGKFQLITDVIGGFSYTDQLSVFMERVLGLLEVGGSFHTLLQDVKSEEGKNQPYYPNAPYLTELKNVDGSELRMCSWLKSISCVKVDCEFKPGWKPPIEVYAVRKVCNDIVVPALELKHYASGTPPERQFQSRK